MSSGIYLPSKESMAEWTDLTNCPALEASAKAVPSAIFIRYNGEDFNNHTPFTNTGLDTSEQIRSIERFDQLIQKGDDIISNLYSRRSFGNPLVKFFGRSTKNPDVHKAVQPHYEQILQYILDFKAYCDEATSEISRFISTDEIWANSKYSDQLLDRVIILFDRLEILDELHLAKTAITNDLTILQGILPATNVSKTEELNFIRLWLSGHCAIENGVVNQIRPHESSIRLAFPVFWNHITNSITNVTYLYPEMLYAYLRFSILLIRINPDPFPADAVKFLVHQASEHPLIPLIYETSCSFVDRFVHLENLHSPPSVPPSHPTDWVSLHNDLLKRLTDLPSQIAAAERGDLDSGEFLNLITSAVHILGQTKNLAREQLANKLSNPPEDSEIKSSFERSLRKGYSDQELETLLQLLVLWRSVSDLLMNSLPVIQSLSSDHFTRIFQQFLQNIDNQLTQIKAKKKGTGPKFEGILTQFIAMFQAPPSYLTEKPSIVTSYGKNRAPPSPSAIEFARAFIQENISQFTGGENGKLRELCQHFIQESRNWVDFIRFDSVLENVGNQSDLYFKEVQLDLNHTINFPIRASLPFMLCEYALNNYMQPELTEKIFYPLGIYDDAAHVAERRLHSRIVMTELEAEAEMCLKTLSTLISDFTFGAFRAYTSLRFLPPSRYNSLQAEFGDHWPSSRAYRLSTLLQQNQFYLFLHQIDMKSLIIRPIDEQMQSAVEGLLYLPTRNGLGSMLAVTRGLDILRETHRLLSEQGLGLMPFDNIIQSVIGDTSPDSFISQFSSAIVNELAGPMAERTHMRTNPLRFIPLSKKALSPAPFGSLTLGKIMKANFEPTYGFVTVDHFTALVRLLPDGFVARMIALFESRFKQALENFVNNYAAVKPNIPRIKDAPMMTPGQLIFDRYDGVYKFFTSDKACLDCLKSMKIVGNMLAEAQLLDIAIESKHQTRAAFIGYLKGYGLDNVCHNDFTKLFNREAPPILNMISKQNPLPTENNIFPPVLSIFLNDFRMVLEEPAHKQYFEEKSKTILDFTSLTGFGAAWSVLEFIYALSESSRAPDQESTLERYGEGVMACAAAALLLSDQIKLHYATSICRRLERVRDLDFSVKSDMKVVRFGAVSNFLSSSLQYLESVYGPIVEYLQGNSY